MAEETKPTTRTEVWRWAEQIHNGSGAARRSATNANAVLHILAGDRRELWCSGGPSISFQPVPGRERYCPECMGLAADMLDDLWDEAPGAWVAS